MTAPMLKILYVQYANPGAYPPLEHSSNILASQGWQVLFWGIKSADTDRIVFPSRKGIEVRQLPFCPPGWLQKFHYLWFIVFAFVLAAFWRPTLMYVSDAMATPAALLPAILLRRRVVYHEHDSPVSGGSSIFMRGVSAARRALARRAELCILPNEERAKHFSEEVSSKRTLCVWNCPSVEEIRSDASAASENGTWVLYHGTIVPARLPVSVINALSLLPPTVRLRVIGYETIGHRGYVQELKNAAVELGLEDRIEFIDSVPRKDLLDWCVRSHLGLAFMPSDSADINMRHMTGASNKAFDYMACGLALLVSDLPEWRRMFVDRGFALACDMSDARSIAGAIDWLLRHPAEMREMGQRARQQIVNEWNYKTQFEPALRLIKAAVGSANGNVSS